MAPGKKQAAKTVKVTATVLAVAAVATFTVNRLLAWQGSSASAMANLAVFALAVVCILGEESLRAWRKRRSR